MDNIELKAQPRTTKGNGPARAMRRDGRIPAVLYGPKSEPNMISIGARDLDNILKQGSIGRSIINLEIDGVKGTTAAMVKEMQTHPMSQNVLHIDFYKVDMTRKIKVNVPVITTGISAGVELGGMLQIIRRELEVYCLPNLIPQAITIDITDLEIGDSVHVNDIEAEGDVEIPHDVDFTVLTILSPKKAEEEGEEVEELEEGEVAEAEAEAEAESEA
ncbi:MAG: 50S ribosomal protein L25/general stress protein Ctc [Desulfobacteraceae bacterium]